MAFSVFATECVASPRASRRYDIERGIWRPERKTRRVPDHSHEMLQNTCSGATYFIHMDSSNTGRDHKDSPGVSRQDGDSA
jgi:hypothetical protein